MKKRTKILSFLAAAVLAVSVMALGFSAWSTDIDINGTVSADGKWDVEVTAADVEVSEGASIAYTEEEEFTAYNAYAVLNTNGKWIVAIDVVNTITVSMTEEEVNNYSNYVYYNSAWTDGTYLELSKSEVQAVFSSKYMYTYLDDTVEVKDYSRVLQDQDYDGESGTYIGYAVTAASVKAAEYDTVEDETAFTAVSIDYADVIFSLPGAYATYTFTVSNYGTVDAVLSDYNFDFGSLDTDVFTVDYAEFADDVTIPAGGSLNVLFTITAGDGVTEDNVVYELTADAVDFDISLTFSAPTVDGEAEDAYYQIITAGTEDEE